MKRLICLWLMVCLLAGCAKAAPHQSFSVVATIFPAYDFARSLLGSDEGVFMLIPPGGEAHGFEPSLQDVNRIKNCDLFIYNGGESDAWVEKILATCDPSPVVVRMTDYVELLQVGEDHHHHTHHHGVEQADEHVWTTPQNSQSIVRGIYEGFVKANPENQGVYEINFRALQGQLEQLEEKYRCLMGQSQPTLVFADRFPFLYLTHQYGLSYVAAFSGCTSNTEASLRAVAELKWNVQKPHTSHTVLCTEFSDGVLAQTVAQGVGGKVARLHSCHTVTQKEWEQKVTYIQLMENNLIQLQEVLDI